MAEIVSFKAKAAQIAADCADGFRSVFVNYEYLVCSQAFTQNPYYIVSAKPDNYMHLTGIPFGNPQLFFDKCINGSICESDISFFKRGQTESEVKGSVRRKIAVLPNLINIFSCPLMAEESFSKNRVICSFGTSDGTCTVGFTLVTNNKLAVRPMTLLRGYELDAATAKPVDLVLRRPMGETLFDTIIIGDNTTLSTYFSKIEPMLKKDVFCRK